MNRLMLIAATVSTATMLLFSSASAHAQERIYEWRPQQGDGGSSRFPRPCGKECRKFYWKPEGGYGGTYYRGQCRWNCDYRRHKNNRPY